MKNKELDKSIAELWKRHWEDLLARRVSLWKKFLPPPKPTIWNRIHWKIARLANYKRSDNPLEK